MSRNDALRYVRFALLASLSAAVLALAFVGWQHFGVDIFLAAIENGIAWCL